MHKYKSLTRAQIGAFRGKSKDNTFSNQAFRVAHFKIVTLEQIESEGAKINLKVAYVLN